MRQNMEGKKTGGRVAKKGYFNDHYQEVQRGKIQQDQHTSEKEKNAQLIVKRHKEQNTINKAKMTCFSSKKYT